MKRLLALALPAVLSLALARPAAAQYLQQDVFSFSAQDQNMWGSGPSAVGIDYQGFLGLSWNNSFSLGGIVGSEHATIIPGGCIWFFGTHCWSAVTADTRTGLQITAQTDGRIGLNIGAQITSGDVDVVIPGRTSISTSSLTAHSPGTLTSIQTTYASDPTSTMHTQFPTLSLYADFVFDVYAGGTTQACFVFAGCDVSSGALFDINATLPLVSLNRNNDGTLKVLGVDVGLGGSLGPVDYQFTVPNLTTDAAAVSTNLTSAGDQNVLDLSVDVPALIADAILPGSSYLLGGDLWGFSYTILGASLGPRFGIGQQFDFVSTPMTTLTFSQAVQPVVGGVTLAPTTSFSAPTGSSMDFLFPDVMTLDVTPTYWLQNSLTVDTDFLSRLGFNLTILELDTPLGTLGPLFQQDYQTSPVRIGLDDRTFGMQFNTYTGATFQLSTVPEPETLLLLGSGLVLVGLVAWRRRVAG